MLNESRVGARRIPAAFPVFSLPRATAIGVMALLFAAAYPASLHAQMRYKPPESISTAVIEASKPVNVSAETVQDSTSADGSTVTVRLEWEAQPGLAQAVQDDDMSRTGFCYVVRRFQEGVRLGGREYCQTSTDNSVEFGVSSSLSSIELQVRFVFDETQKGTNSDTVTVTLSG